VQYIATITIKLSLLTGNRMYTVEPRDHQ